MPHLTDPTRPQVGGRPAWQHHLTAIPELSIWPLSHDMCRISMMLPVHDGFKWFQTLANTSLLPRWLEDFRNDPERAVFHALGWEPPAPTKQSLASFTLE